MPRRVCTFTSTSDTTSTPSTAPVAIPPTRPNPTSRNARSRTCRRSVAGVRTEPQVEELTTRRADPLPRRGRAPRGLEANASGPGRQREQQAARRRVARGAGPRCSAGSSRGGRRRAAQAGAHSRARFSFVTAVPGRSAFIAIASVPRSATTKSPSMEGKRFAVPTTRVARVFPRRRPEAGCSGRLPQRSPVTRRRARPSRPAAA